jgi:hypothetical protein
MPTAETTDYGPELGGNYGAGDENRTRAISLGIPPIHAVRIAGQPGRGTVSTRDCLLFTLVNCTQICTVILPRTPGRPRFHREGWCVPSCDDAGTAGRGTQRDPATPRALRRAVGRAETNCPGSGLPWDRPNRSTQA